VIRPKLSLRRPLAVLGAAFLGLTAAVAVASPASAHHSEVKVEAECDTTTGEWVLTWTVDSIAPRNVKNYKLVAVEAKSFAGRDRVDISIPGIAVTEGQNYPHTVGTPLVATHRLPGEATGANLKVKAKWENGHREDKFAGAEIKFSDSCVEEEEPPPPATPKPSATVASDCDGTVVVKLQNAEDATGPAKFTVTGEGDFVKEETVAPGAEASVTVPAENAGNIVVTEESQQEPLFDDTPPPAEDCVAPGEPTLSYAETCDELIFEFINPQDGEEFTITLTPNTGEPQTVTVAPGSTETVSFPAEEGLEVVPSADGEEGDPIAWQQPEDCDTGGDGGGLPVTGAAAGGIAGGAALLLAVGGGLFFLARRRRVTFTA
jgi:hypothetical protein